MIRLRWDEGCEPVYMTLESTAADLKAREDVIIPAGRIVKVPTGVYIEHAAMGLDIQVRLRSSLAMNRGLMLANGIGTIDADYKDEICVLLVNTTASLVKISKFDRIAQLFVGYSYRIPSLNNSNDVRVGGFGSTDQFSEESDRLYNERFKDRDI